MSTIDQITALIGELSFSEKLSINEQLASAIRKEGKVKSKGDKADKPKRKAALGTLAWTAYVKHIKTTQPDAFEGITKESEKLVIVKGIKAEDPAGYASFTEAWKAEQVIDDEVETAPSPKEKKTEKKVTKVVEKKVEKKVAKKVTTAKKDVPSMPQVEIDGTSYWHDPSSNGLWEVTGETIEDGTGRFEGYYQPGNEEEPIRFAENFGE